MDNENFGIIVDGQCITVLANQRWSSLLKQPIYQDLPIFTASTENIVRKLVNLVANNPEKFVLGLFKSKQLKKAWGVIPLYKSQGGWQRVQIEYVTCSCCGWQGAIANPSEASLYFGLDKEWELTKKAFTLMQVGCPRCNEKLPRFAIWTDVDSGDISD